MKNFETIAIDFFNQIIASLETFNQPLESNQREKFRQLICITCSYETEIEKSVNSELFSLSEKLIKEQVSSTEVDVLLNNLFSAQQNYKSTNSLCRNFF